VSARRGWLAALAVAGAVLSAAPPAGAQGLDQVVAGIEAAYGRVNDLRAEFSQVAHNKSLGQDIPAEGVVSLKKGGQRRWEYRRPTPQLSVAEGTSGGVCARVGRRVS
jgi:outer membrane lipoprotein-sorting protein